MNAGNLVICLIEALQAEGLPCVYLRNYEQLPAAVGNDVDLLIPGGAGCRVLEILQREAARAGWCYLGSARFSSRAVYFADPVSAATLHVDLFERIAWHFLEYADAALLLARRRWNGLVFIPDERDGLYLNLCARLIYQGNIREKHRTQAAGLLADEGAEFVASAFARHLGNQGRALASELSRRDWAGSAALRSRIRRLAWLRYGMRRPLRTAGCLLGYGLRILAKLARPPGRFLVFEGADGVGKSTVMEAVVPWCAKWCAGRAPYDFHWKPVELRTGPRARAPGVDPRGKPPRGTVASFMFLLYHVAGFWWGWLFRIYPLLVRAHLVVGDRYSYDMFLDPGRFRLNLPSWLCRLAALSTPRPVLAIGLVADPARVHARKPELEPAEIKSYQDRWQSIANGRAWMLTVGADGPVEEVIQRVKQSVLAGLAVRNKAGRGGPAAS